MKLAVIIVIIVMCLGCEGTNLCLKTSGNFDKIGMSDAEVELCIDKRLSSANEAPTMLDENGDEFILLSKKNIENAVDLIDNLQPKNLSKPNDKEINDENKIQTFLNLTK